MTAEQLAVAGVALYGAHWHSALARALGVSEGLVRFWMSGARGMPAGLPQSLDALLAERINQLRCAKRFLKKRRRGA